MAFGAGSGHELSEQVLSGHVLSNKVLAVLVALQDSMSSGLTARRKARAETSKSVLGGTTDAVVLYIVGRGACCAVSVASSSNVAVLSLPG